MSPNQRKALAFVREQLDLTGVSPSYQEIARHLGISVPGAWKVTQALLGQGQLVKTRAVSRNLALPGEVDLSTVPTEQLRKELAHRGATLDGLARPKPRVLRGAECAAPQCGAKVQRGHLMCRDHWFKVPQAVRSDLLHAFGRRDAEAYQRHFERAVQSLGTFTTVMARAQ